MTARKSQVQRCTAFRTAKWAVKTGRPPTRCRAWATAGTDRCHSHPRKRQLWHCKRCDRLTLAAREELHGPDCKGFWSFVTDAQAEPLLKRIKLVNLAL